MINQMGDLGQDRMRKGAACGVWRLAFELVRIFGSDTELQRV